MITAHEVGEDLDQNSTMRGVTRFWHAMRVSCSHKLLVKTVLDQQKIKGFVPITHKQEVEGNENPNRKLEQVINNLFFVRTTQERLKNINSWNIVLHVCATF